MISDTGQSFLGALPFRFRTYRRICPAVPQGLTLPLLQDIDCDLYVYRCFSGTVGGIKTTTVALMLLFIFSIIRGRTMLCYSAGESTRPLFCVRLQSLRSAFSFVFTAIIIVSLIEYERPITLSDTIYEVVSSFGTVGRLAVPLISPTQAAPFS